MARHATPQESECFIDELTSIFRKPILFEEIPIHIDARVGHVNLAKHESPESHLRMAQCALTEACDKACDYVAYNPALSKASKENIVILGELLAALTEKQLSLHYQPKVDISTGVVHSVEALIRWDHPQRGNIPPGLFIPRA